MDLHKYTNLFELTLKISPKLNDYPRT